MIIERLFRDASCGRRDGADGPTSCGNFIAKAILECRSSDRIRARVTEPHGLINQLSTVIDSVATHSNEKQEPNNLGRCVAYDPKVVTIWEGMRRYFHDEARLSV